MTEQTPMTEEQRIAEGLSGEDAEALLAHGSTDQAIVESLQKKRLIEFDDEAECLCVNEFGQDVIAILETQDA